MRVEAAADWLLARIASGEWAPGRRLPSRRRLAREAGTSLATMCQAAHRLLADGRLRAEGYGLIVSSLEAGTEGVRGIRALVIGGSQLVSGVQAAAIPLGILVERGDPDLLWTSVRPLAAAVERGVRIILAPWNPYPAFHDAMVHARDQGVRCVFIGEPLPGFPAIVRHHDAALEALVEATEPAVAHVLLHRLLSPVFGSLVLRAWSKLPAARRGRTFLVRTVERAALEPLLRGLEQGTVVHCADFELAEAVLAVSRAARRGDLQTTCLAAWTHDARRLRGAVVAHYDEALMGALALSLAVPPRGPSKAPPACLTLAPVITSQKRAQPARISERTESPTVPRMLDTGWPQPPGGWMSLALERWANRTISRPNGWITPEPLHYFPPGLRTFEEVPLQILDDRTGPAIVVFRSRHARLGLRGPLPCRVRIPVDRRVSCVAFLHACSYAEPRVFGTCTFRRAEGPTDRVPLLPLGVGKRAGKTAPVVQDWWYGFPVLRTPDVRPWRICAPYGSEPYERYVYLWRWENPFPDDLLLDLAIRVHGRTETTYALLAITLGLA